MVKAHLTRVLAVQVRWNHERHGHNALLAQDAFARRSRMVLMSVMQMVDRDLVYWRVCVVRNGVDHGLHKENSAVNVTRVVPVKFRACLTRSGFIDPISTPMIVNDIRFVS